MNPETEQLLMEVLQQINQLSGGALEALVQGGAGAAGGATGAAPPAPAPEGAEGAPIAG